MNPYLDRIPIVAKEMRHLLWGPERDIRDGKAGWWNCADHAVMTAALMWINDYEVDILGGEAFFAQSQKSTGATACLNQVKRHWWITAKNVGVIDFSPDLSVSNSEWDRCDFDYVFANKVFAGEEWSFHQANRAETVKAKLNAIQKQVGKYACIYFCQNKKAFTGSVFLEDHIIANQNGETWAQAALLYHLQRLLENERDSLCCLPVKEAWESLRSVPESDIHAVTSRLTR